jgi:hypothetical protein
LAATFGCSMTQLAVSTQAEVMERAAAGLAESEPFL